MDSWLGQQPPANFGADARGSRRPLQPRPVIPHGNTASLPHACAQRRAFTIRDLNTGKILYVYIQILTIYVSENSHFFIFEFQICNDALVLKSAAVPGSAKIL
jgi:hypothetical protein